MNSLLNKIYRYNDIILFILIFLILTFNYINFEKINNTFDLKIRNIFFEIRGKIKTTNNITIIDINDKTIKELGQWPFSRLYMAQVLSNLSKANAGIIGLDIIFSEKDRNSPSHMAKALNIKGDFINSDKILSTVISNTPTIIGYYFSNNQLDYLSPKVQTTFDTNNSMGILNFKSVVTNISNITNNAYSSGFFNAFYNDNGQITNMPLIVKYKNKIYPSLTLEMINIAKGINRASILEENSSIFALKLKDLIIPINHDGFMDINFRGAKNTFKYISFLDILNNNFDKKDIIGKFILIGTSANALADIRSTPYDVSMPGVEIHANIIDNILQQDFIYQPSYKILFDISMIFLLTIILGYILLKSNYKTIFFIVLLISYATYFLLFDLLFTYGLIFNLLYPILSIIITTIVALFLNNIKERNKVSIIKNKFSKKVSKDIVDELIKNKTDLFYTAEDNVTIFFSDIRDFTKISEDINSAQKLINMLNSYLEPMSNIIIKNKGTIDKFIGDSIMAYWNAPLKVKNHENIAVQSAINQIETLQTLNIQLNRDFSKEFRIGIGIHTGKVMIGEIGSHNRSDYTIIGDNVNLASRIEGLTKYFEAKILISQSTKNNLMPNYYNLKYIGNVIVTGKNNEIQIYEVLIDEDYKKFKIVEDRYNDAINNFKNKNYKISLDIFKEIDEIYPSKINKLYINKLKNDIKIFNFIFNKYK